MQIKKIVFSSLVVFLAIGLFLIFSSPVRASVTVIPASDGTTISADDYETGSWTTLGSIAITEGAAGDIGTGTIILTAPSGFEFNTAQAVDVAVTGDGELAASTPATVEASTITISVTTASTSATNTMTIGSGTKIQVRPTAGTPLASGNIYMDDTSTSTVSGVTKGSSGTNFGTLTEIVGAASKVAFTTQAATPSVANVAFATQPIVTIEDQFGNIRNRNTDTVTLTGYTDSLCTSPVSAGVLTGTLTKDAVNGIADFSGNGVKFTASGNLWLKAEASGLATDCSNVIVVNPAPITDLACEPSGQAGAVWLRWTVPYGIIDAGSGYSGQYHSGNSVTWGDADNVAFGTSWARADQGTSEQELVTGMNPGTQYTFVMHVLGNDSTSSADSNKVACYAPSGASLSSDTTAPTSYITEPANKSAILAGQEYVIKGTAIDTGGSSIQKVEVSLDSGTTWHLAKITSVLDSNDLWEFTWYYPTTGEYNIKTRATDWVGNIETPGAGINITVASELPSEEVIPTTPTTPTAEKPVSEMTVTEVRAKIVELQQKVIDLLTQLLQMLQAQISGLK